MTDYSEEQLGDIRVQPLNSKTKGRFSLVVVQPSSNEQLLLLEPCDWDVGRARVVSMVRAGVDPADIRFSWRGDGQLNTDGLPLRPCMEALWWTERDQRLLDKEREAENVG